MTWSDAEEAIGSIKANELAASAAPCGTATQSLTRCNLLLPGQQRESATTNLLSYERMCTAANDVMYVWNCI